MLSTRYRMPGSSAALAVLIALVAWLALPAVHAAEIAGAGDEESKPADSRTEPKFLRVDSRAGESIALEIALTTYTPPETGGPTVHLVGVSHIGDRSYYRALQQTLDGYDVVLYESVKPAGTGGAGGETDAERIASTRAAMEFIAGLASTYYSENDRLPKNLDELRTFAASIDVRMSAFIDTATVDAWGRPIEYQYIAPQNESGGVAPSQLARTGATKDGKPRVHLISLGADGEPGGEGAAADIRIVDPLAIDPLTPASEDGLQSDLARSLNLAFQLDAIDYGHENWQCSDMSMDQLQRAMNERGADFELIEGTLAGSSFPAKIARALLWLIRSMDAISGGQVSDTIKVVLIEMLADESLIELSMTQFDEGFAEAIINDRNQVVIEDLKTLIAERPDVESVGIFYGAGHLADLGDRLEQQLGYEAAETEWMPAITVDLAESNVSEAEVRQIRVMMRRMIHQMKKMSPPGR
jgi:hypothetical protein